MNNLNMFLGNIYRYILVNDIAMPSNSNSSSNSNPNAPVESGSSNIILWCVIGAVVLAIGAVIVIKMINKKKNK